MRPSPALLVSLLGSFLLQATAHAHPALVVECAPEHGINPLAGLAEITRAADPDAPTLPACASPLARAVFEGATRHLDEATTSAAMFATGANRADPNVLVTGPEIFPRMAEMIEHAEQEVLLQTFVWKDSDATREILGGIRRLEQRRRLEAPADAEPVTVRILVDAVDAPEDRRSGMASGVLLPRISKEIESLGLDERYVRVEVAAFLHTAMGALHSKAIVVDGRTAMLTGANPQPQHDYAHPWHDAGFVLEGEIGAALREEFGTAWKKSGRWRCGGRHPWGPSHCIERTDPLPALAARPAAGACVPMMVLGRKADGNPFGNRADNPAGAGYVAAFRNAERVIRMHTPNLNDDVARRELVAAVQRGVDVEIVLSKSFNDTHENLPGQGGDNGKNVEKLHRMLREAGVQDSCERLRVRWYSEDGRAPVDGNVPGASHTKYLSVDDRIAIVGSSNMDTQSWNHSREVNVLVDDAATVRAWDARLFTESWNRAIPACP